MMFNKNFIIENLKTLFYALIIAILIRSFNHCGDWISSTLFVIDIVCGAGA